MKWFNNSIRLTAKEPDWWVKHLDQDKQQQLINDNMFETPQGNFGRPLWKNVKQKPEERPQGIPGNTPPPGSPVENNLPPIMPSNPAEHINPVMNPFHDLEQNDPTLSNFATSTPARMEKIGRGIRGARFHFANPDSKTAYGVAKSDANSSLTEPLVHHIDSHLGFNMVPPTVVRMYPAQRESEDTNIFGDPANTLYPHSVQQYVPGKDQQHLNYPEFVAHAKHLPKLQLLDYLVSNGDRHPGNMKYDPKTDRLHAIDNGGAFQKNHSPNFVTSLDDYNNLIDPELKKRLLSSDNKHLAGLFQNVNKAPNVATAPGINPRRREYDSHPRNGFLRGNFEPGSPSEAYIEFQRRLNKTKEHLQDPKVRTYKDLAKRLVRE